MNIDIVQRVNGVATITINRPEKLNAFRGQTCEELIHAFNLAGWKKEIGVIVFTEQVIGRFALVGINPHMKAPMTAVVLLVFLLRNCKA